MQIYTKLAIFLAISTSINVANVFANNLPKLPYPSHPNVNYSLKLSAISALRVEGAVHVQLITNPSFRTASYVIEGPKQPWVSAVIKRHTLYLQNRSGRSAGVIVKMPQINYLSVYGHAQINGRNVRSDGLTIRNDSGRIHLTGILSLHKIINDGSGYINVSWSNSQKLTVLGYGYSHTYLAGLVQHLYVRLQNHAQLNATYLRARNIFIATRDSASAKVLPIDSLHAFAKDQSNIYYYKYPRAKNLLTEQRGNVLQLGWHD